MPDIEGSQGFTSMVNVIFWNGRVVGWGSNYRGCSVSIGSAGNKYHLDVIPVVIELRYNSLLYENVE